MAGPPLALSSSTNTNANVQKDGNRDDQPCPKRRRKSIDEPRSVADGTTSFATPATPAAAGAQQDGGPKEVTCRPLAHHTTTRAADGLLLIPSATAGFPGLVGARASGEEGQDPGAGVVGDGDANSVANGDDVPNPLAAKGDDDGASGEGTRPEGDDKGEAGAGSAAVDTNPNADKPDGSKIARARSAWMLFLADNREKVRNEHPGLAVGPMQKILSEMWKALGEEEVARYAKLAAEDKERMKSELAAAGLTKLPSKNSNASASVPGGATSLVLPLARVRKTVRLDPAVGNISKEGLLLVTKATEVFMAFVADHAWKIGRQTGRKSVRPCDVADFVFTSPEMYWLKDEFRDERSSVKKQSKPEASGAKGAGAGRTGVVAVPKAANPITSFFKKA
ncbi:unnamed protein product [Scytosiphon promiscuus]